VTGLDSGVLTVPVVETCDADPGVEVDVPTVGGELTTGGVSIGPVDALTIEEGTTCGGTPGEVATGGGPKGPVADGGGPGGPVAQMVSVTVTVETETQASRGAGRCQYRFKMQR
jgi:hypothetical protein